LAMATRVSPVASEIICRWKVRGALIAILWITVNDGWSN
jgi:hypothetical protein